MIKRIAFFLLIPGILLAQVPSRNGISLWKDQTGTKKVVLKTAPTPKMDSICFFVPDTLPALSGKYLRSDSTGHWYWGDATISLSTSGGITGRLLKFTSTTGVTASNIRDSSGLRSDSAIFGNIYAVNGVSYLWPSVSDTGYLHRDASGVLVWHSIPSADSADFADSSRITSSFAGFLPVDNGGTGTNSASFTDGKFTYYDGESHTIRGSSYNANSFVLRSTGHSGHYTDTAGVASAALSISGLLAVDNGGTGTNSTAFTDGKFTYYDGESHTIRGSAYNSASFASAGHNHSGVYEPAFELLAVDNGGTGTNSAAFTDGKFTYYDGESHTIRGSSYNANSFVLRSTGHSGHYTDTAGVSSVSNALSGLLTVDNGGTGTNSAAFTDGKFTYYDGESHTIRGSSYNVNSFVLRSTGHSGYYTDTAGVASVALSISGLLAVDNGGTGTNSSAFTNGKFTYYDGESHTIRGSAYGPSSFVTSESDPTVYNWAKQALKPTYTYTEVGAAAAAHTHDYTAIFVSRTAGHSGHYTDTAGVASVALSISGLLAVDNGGTGTNSSAFTNGKFTYYDGESHTIRGSAYGPSSFLTSESDPTIYSWAKQALKPTYTYTEVGAAASGHNHSGVYIPVGGESDPTVYNWAKQALKPTYTYTEVGAASSTHNHDVAYVSLSGSYSNPSWITGLAWSKISGVGGWSGTLHLENTSGGHTGVAVSNGIITSAGPE